MFVLSPRRTRSLDRAADVITYLREHIGEPVSVQQIADAAESYYEETLHVLTTLEALGLVERYFRDGSPREGARVAYLWLQPTKKRNMKERAAYKASARDPKLQKAS